MKLVLNKSEITEILAKAIAEKMDQRIVDSEDCEFIVKDDKMMEVKVGDIEFYCLDDFE